MMMLCRRRTLLSAIVLPVLLCAVWLEKPVVAEVLIHYGVCATEDFMGLCTPQMECASLTNKSETELRAVQCHEAINKELYCCDLYPVEEPVVTKAKRADLFLQYPECGRTVFAPRIVKGIAAELDEYPWTVLLEISEQSGQKDFRCAGSLINDRWVITAAHCVTRPGLDAGQYVSGARLGEWNIDTNPDCAEDFNSKLVCAPPPIDVGIDKIIPHPEYNAGSRNFSNDVALLRLAFPVSFNDYVRPVCLPLEPSLLNLKYDQLLFDVAGWGRTGSIALRSSIKQKAELRATKQEDCVSMYKSLQFELDNTVFCAKGDNGAATCRGDSGGPLTQLTRHREYSVEYIYLAGVVSFGNRFCAPGGSVPALYTRVTQYMKWIERTLLRNSD